MLISIIIFIVSFRIIDTLVAPISVREVESLLQDLLEPQLSSSKHHEEEITSVPVKVQ